MASFRKLFLYAVLCCSVFVSVSAYSQSDQTGTTVPQTKSSQKIQDIRVQGLKQVSDSTVFENLPIELDENFTSSSASETSQQLLETGLFQEVDVFFEKNIVFIKVVENESVASQKIQDIRVQGLKQVRESTVFENLAINIDEDFTSSSASETTQQLLKTGLFQEVDVFFEKNIVFIKVVENESVASQRIQDIRIQGLKRVNDTTVFEILPIELDGNFTSSSASETIRELFKTGLFQEVDVFFEKNIVFIKVVENASIISISIDGNEIFSDEVLREVMTENGISEGQIFRPQIGDVLIKELKRQYLNEGKYAARVDLSAVQIADTRIALDLIVEEGETAKIDKITFIGNKFFSDRKLKRSFRSKAGRRLSPFSRANRYSRSKVTADIEKMRTMYTNEGFADFKVTSSRVSINPEKDAVFLTLSVEEGPRYKVESFTLNGRLTVDESELLPLVAIRPKEFFSSRDVQTTVANISAFLADKGFSNARVVPVPEFNPELKTVKYAINVNPEKTVFVRRISFAGNNKTRNNVLRREMKQIEGAVLSTSKVQESTRRLRRLSYITQADISTVPVPDDPNQVDLVVNIQETSSASVSFGGGVSGDDGVILQAAYSETNFLGTGRAIDFRLDTSQSDRSLQLNYLNPYITRSGISRRIGLIFNRRETEDNDTAEFVQDTLGLNVNYRFPLGNNLFFNLGGTAERIDLDSTDNTPPEFVEFIDENPESDIFRINTRFGYDSRDSILAPTNGWFGFVNLELALPGSDLEFYRLDVNSDYFFPLTERFTLKSSFLLNFGDGFGDTDSLPFFRNYFAGGTTTVRGFQPRSLGPRDSTEDNDPIGGPKRVIFNTTLLAPIPGTAANAGRIGLFVDSGQVFADDESIDFSELRTSVGISFNFFTPIGPVAISWATPVDEREGDETESLQFTIGRFLD